jgi:hypothetical protein
MPLFSKHMSTRAYKAHGENTSLQLCFPDNHRIGLLRSARLDWEGDMRIEALDVVDSEANIPGFADGRFSYE